MIIVVLVITLAIAFIIIVAYILQQLLVVRRFSLRSANPPLEQEESQNPELSEKLRSHLGMEVPTHDIKSLLPIPNSDDKIVLLRYKLAFQNVLRCRSDGSLVWQAELPEAIGDFYTHIDWSKQGLRANSWSSFSVILDVESGKILSSVFTK